MHNARMYDATDDPIPTSDLGGQTPLSDIPFTLRRRLNWGDSDTAEIAYTGSFVPFAIDTVEVWYEAVLGFSFYELKRNNMGCPAVSMHFDFHAPIVVGERLDIAIFLEKLGRSSITHRIEMTKFGGPLVCTASFTSALVSKVNSPDIEATPFPDEWRERIEGYQRECDLRPTGVRSRREVLNFWFGPPGSPERGQQREIWWARQDAGGSDFDEQIRQEFGASVEAAAAGKLDHWAYSIDGTLALCILLDQFTRNIYRGTAQAFASDGKILDIVKRAIAAGWHKDMHPTPVKFLLMPFQHSEDLADQEQSVELFGALRGDEGGDRAYGFAVDHRDVIAKLGRFPHRNAALGRTNTVTEEEYLQDPDAGF